MADLATTYLGLELKNPLVASASPLTAEVGAIRELEDAGVSAVVLRSLFEEQITVESHQLDRFLSHGAESYAEALNYFPELPSSGIGPEDYLKLVSEAKAAVGIPVIGSLNGISSGGWIRYAKLIEEAGADALELNIYSIPTDPNLTSNEVEDMYTTLVREIRAGVRIPIAVKVGPYFSALAHFSKRLEEAGAEGLVLFNRFYQPDFDLENLEVIPDLVLSRPDELRLRLLWVAVLFGQVKADLAVTGGVHSARDIIKSMMAGARAAMATSAFLKHGARHASVMIEDLEDWMEENEYESIRQMQGSMSRKSVSDAGAFERLNYMKVLGSYRPEKQA